jgi:hypothetical protein
VSAAFVLDLAENPHPRLLEHALHLRRAARATNDPIVGAMWLGYTDCACDATGWNAETFNAWLDSHDDPDLATKIAAATAVQVRGPSRR